VLQIRDIAPPAGVRAAMELQVTHVQDNQSQHLGCEQRSVHLPDVETAPSHAAQAEAERRKRASILESEGARQSKINVEEGNKAGIILSSEAAQQDSVNRAVGG
jgi:regulator of protease activity HflC (stomatin/prohibitin superfamily)